jgi:hypothetical protein
LARKSPHVGDVGWIEVGITQVDVVILLGSFPEKEE